MAKRKTRKAKRKSKALAPIATLPSLDIPWSDKQPDDLILFLAEGQEDALPVIYAVVPPDLKRCQCEWRDQTVGTFGPKPSVRCDQRPTTVAFQKRAPGDDGPTGAISLCADHKVLLMHMHPGMCYFREITADEKIGGFV